MARPHITLKYCRDLSKERGGNCLSRNYINSRIKLKWICSEGHEWRASHNAIQQGRWCAQCSEGLGEKICRVVLEKAFKIKFLKTRPSWLINKRGNQMELDGYNTYLGLAFEYNGKQHYKKIYFFHNQHSLQKRKSDDRQKIRLCLRNKVNLIVVPYTIGINNISTFLYEQSKSLGFKVLKKNFFWRPREIYFSRSRKIKLMRAVAHKKGGTCLSQNYLSVTEKLLWQCNKKHQWEATPDNIQRGKWCPWCIGRGKTIIDIQTLANKNGGECLSRKFFNAHDKLNWRCNKGHEWQASANACVLSGRWCGKCKNTGPAAKKSIIDMQKIAASHGGQCISNQYSNRKQVLRWRCSKNHEWNAVAGNIISGNWCPGCTGRGKTVHDMQILAMSRSGICLSKKFMGVDHKLTWQCKENHIWNAKPKNIQNGTWCPFCARRKIGDALRGALEEMQSIASKNNGTCLSTAYKNRDTKLEWKCAIGHRWFTSARNIKNGTWCRICATKKNADLRRGSIEEMWKIGLERGGECLSTYYQDSNSYLRWRCAKGHEWNAKPHNIKNGTWCRKCAWIKVADKQRSSIHKMQILAKKKGGVCLSDTYINSKKKLKWCCQFGHEWYARPDNMRNGWCALCPIPPRQVAMIIRTLNRNTA